MDRRTLLSTLAAGAAGAGGVTAGCGYRLLGPVESQTFDICDGDCDWADRTPEAGERPNVVPNSDETRITVYGHTYVGSSSCDRAVLESATVTDGTLRVVVAVGNRGLLPSTVCTMDVSADEYRAVFQFRESLPGRIVVEEDGPMETRTTATAEG